MRRLEVLIVGMALVLGACRGTVVDRVPIAIALPSAPDCRDTIGQITLTALGDFPTSDVVIAELDGSGAPLDPITHFPQAMLALSGSARALAGWEAFGWATRTSLASDPTLRLRPIGLSCPIADSEARLPLGAMAVAIDEATVLLYGGLDDSGSATRRVAFLRVRDETVDLPRMDDAIQTAFGAATLVPEGDAVLVTGGSSHADGDGNPAWVRIPFDGSPLQFGVLFYGGRRDHGAIAVSTSIAHGVLIVGGSDGREMVRGIEWIDAGQRQAGHMGSMLTARRVAPLLVSLDHTRVAIVGGRSAIDATAPLVTSIEILDVAHDMITTSALVIDPIAPPTMATMAPDWITALPGGRVAWSWMGRLRVGVIDGGRIDDSVVLPQVFDPVATALPNGAILLEGHRSDGTRLGYVIDPSAGTVNAATTSRVARSLLAVPDGSTLELATSGASLRRDRRGTPFDSPPNTYFFGVDQAAFTLDLASHWTTAAGALTPIGDARLDLPMLRFARFDALIDATGDYDVLLTGESLEPLGTVSVTQGSITQGSITFGTCVAPRSDASARVRISRQEGGVVVLGTENGPETRCDSAVTDARVGIAIVAHTGAGLRSMALSRPR